MGPLLLATALAAAVGIELDWPENACPNKAQIAAFIGSLSGARRADPIVVHGEKRGGVWLLEVRAGGARFTREVAATGTCEDQAAIVAAIATAYLALESPLEPPIEPEPAVTATAAQTATIAVPIEPEPAPAPAETVTEPRIAPPETEPKATWLSATFFVALATTGAGAGVEIGASRAPAHGFGFGARASLRLPRTAEVGGGEARLDLFAVSLLGLYTIDPRFRLEGGLSVEIASAQSTGIAVPGQALRFSPVLAAGAVYRPLGTPSIELFLRGNISAIPQRFLVDDAVILERPLLELTAGIGAGFDL